MMQRKALVPLLVIIAVSSQLMACSSVSNKEFVDLLNKGEAIEIVVAVPEDFEEGTLQRLSWTELDQLETYPEFREEFDYLLHITKFGEDSKNGILYTDLEGNHQGNNTLYNAFANNAFRNDYWKNEDVQEQVQEAVLKVYADVEAGTEEVKVSALNAYYNLLPDGETNYFNGESLLTRGEFMAFLFRSENPVDELESNEEFRSLVGESEYTDYAYSLVEDSYLSTSDKSLNERTFNGTITRGEAIYMLMHHYFSDELGSITSKEVGDIKNGGNISEKQKFSGDYSTSVELIYSLQNVEAGAPEEIYQAVALAHDKGIISGETRWDEGLTKSEAYELLVDTLLTMPSKGSWQQGASTAETKETQPEIVDSVGEIIDDVTAEAVNQVMAQDIEIEEKVVNDMEATMYTTADVALRAEYSVASEKLRTVLTDETVHVTGRTEDGLWYRVDDSYKGEGFIAAEYLTDVAPVKESAPSESTQSEAERQAAEEAVRKAEEERQAEEQRQLEEAIKQQEQIIEENQNIPEEDLEPAPESTYQPEAPTQGGTGGGSVDWSGWSDDGWSDLEFSTPPGNWQ